MYLRSHGEYLQVIDETSDSPLPELKDWLVDAVGQPVRRISRFMQLALIGAGRCARGSKIPADTAVYLASSRGDLEITVDVMNHVFRDGQSPKPLSFVNTVSNSAAFYVAKCLKLDSRSSFVCSRYLAFEDALQLALVDFQLGAISSALIGTVDCAVLPLHAHRQRLELDNITPLAEASHWLWLTRDATESTGISQNIADVYSASDRDELLRWIQSRNLGRSTTALSAGQYLTVSDFSHIQQQSGVGNTFDYRNSRGYYPSQSAAAIAAFIEGPAQQQTLLHINADNLGRYAAVLLHR
jgi:hypothetical protein